MMLGTSPFGQRPAGRFNHPMPERKGLIYFEETPKRIRAVFAGETVVDSPQPKMLHEHGHLPIYYFPERDVRMDLLESTDKSTRCPWKGEASYWSVRVGDRVAEDAVWSYPEPLEGAPPLAGHFAFYWNPMDEWYEEDERAVVHPRDPYHRIDVRDSSRRVRVLVNDEAVADSERVRILFETGIPPRYYVPAEDIRMDLLEETDSSSGCAYKGFANYYTVRAGGGEEEDLAWVYRDPLHDGARIRDYICFYNERCDIEVEGERHERPQTQWSPGGKPVGGLG